MVHGPRFSLVVSRFQDLLPSGLREAMAVFFATSTTKVCATLLRVVQASLGVFSWKFSFRMENKRKTSEEKHFDDFIKRVRIARLSVPICGNHIVRQRDRRRQHLGMHSIRSHQHFLNMSMHMLQARLASSISNHKMPNISVISEPIDTLCKQDARDLKASRWVCSGGELNSVAGWRKTLQAK